MAWVVFILYVSMWKYFWSVITNSRSLFIVMREVMMIDDLLTLCIIKKEKTMKAILRKGMAVCATVLMGANVMAQSLNFTKEFEGDFWPNTINTPLTKDGIPRIVIDEQTLSEEVGYYYNYLTRLIKLTILDSSLSIEKEFTSGPLFEEFEDISVRFKYIADEQVEIERRSAKGGIYYEDDIPYWDLITNSERGSAKISQTLFNDDDKYEFILPEMAVFETTYKDWWNENEDWWNETYETTFVTYYEHRVIGYKIVSEDGTILHKIILNEEKDPDMECSAYIMSIGEKNYLVIYYHASENEDKIIEGYEVTRFYEIKKDSNGANIQKVREMSGSMIIRPTVANRDEQITITLNEENSNVARELIVTGVNGQLIERRDIPAGKNTVRISASMFSSGMYNFTLQKKGQIIDNGKVIVK